ncbi:hypothetical protein ACVWZL_002444 [Bradyrhizobium sp. GM2.4]
MGNEEWASATTAELWRLYDEVTTVLSRRMIAEKAKLEERLRRIEGTSGAPNGERARRPYPPVLPKYQNPKKPVRDLVRSWQATPLAEGAAPSRQEAERFVNQPFIQPQAPPHRLSPATVATP